ncbi:hypothetical protein R7Q38_08905 [Vibrio sp. Vb0598]|uniref:hypothetical protein n=1 Tax=Vibrio sp. Vb0598 TaxID=3074627 RepID=UPI00296455A7|nr:hypothetical protein [Vibrio sp. Vb0598]MDW1870096.1 hypothetical protein [Vibrio sp. Vb0598]
MIEQVKINETGIDAIFCKPFESEGLFSNNKLAGIRIELEDISPDQQKIVTELLGHNEVNVIDPFSKREYSAKMTKPQEKFSSGNNLRSYTLEVIETDSIPYFEKIELNGKAYEILSYGEKLYKETISKQGVVKLAPEAFDEFKVMLLEPEVNVARLGLDDEPVKMRFGSSMFWSKHESEEGVYYKHIFRLFDYNLEPSKNNFACRVTQNNSVSLLIDYSLKLESVIELLSQEKCLSPETRDILRDLKPKEVLNDIVINNTLDCISEVIDAEDAFSL